MSGRAWKPRAEAFSQRNTQISQKDREALRKRLEEKFTSFDDMSEAGLLAYSDSAILTVGPNLVYTEKTASGLADFVQRFLECVEICREALAVKYTSFQVQQHYEVKAQNADLCKIVGFFGENPLGLSPEFVGGAMEHKSHRFVVGLQTIDTQSYLVTLVLQSLQQEDLWSKVKMSSEVLELVRDSLESLSGPGGSTNESGR
jgi:hypothetical protein